MLQRVCEYIHNYFIKEMHCGSWEIAGGMISLPFLLNGQRFLIVNSMLNDGVYTYHSGTITDDDDAQVVSLNDERFDGCICAMAVPKAVLDGVNTALEWKAANKAALDSPYTSENVSGMYSYTKSAELTDASNGLGLPAHIASVFERWRKPCL